MSDAQQTPSAPRAKDAPDDVRHAVVGSLTNYLVALLKLGMLAFHLVGSRLFGKAAYGAWGFAGSVCGVAARLAVFGFDKTVMRGVATARARRDGTGDDGVVVLGSSLRLTLITAGVVLAAVVLLAGAIARWLGQPELAGTVRALSPLVVLFSLTDVLMNAIMATRTMRFNLLVRGLAEPLLMIVALVTFALLWPRGGGRALATAHVAAALMVTALAFASAGRVFGARRLAAMVPRAPLDWSLLRFSAPVGFGELLNYAMYRTDVIMIGMYLGALAEADYVASLVIAEVLSNVRWAFDPILSPVVAEAALHDDRARMAANLKLMVRWVALLSLPLFLTIAIFGDSILALWGESYREAAPALALLAAAHLVNAVVGLNQWPIVMSGRPRLDLVNNAVGFAVNVVLNVTLIPRLGLVGGGLAVLAANVVFRGLQLIEVRVIFGISSFSPHLARALVAGALGGAAMLAVRRVLPGAHLSLVRLGAGVPAGLAVYALALAVLGLAPEEKRLLRRALTRLRRG